MNTFCELFGIELPVIQAPMAGVQDAALAAAVCGAGGLGSLPCAMLGPDALRDELIKLRSLTSASFNLNFFCHAPPAPNAAREAAWRNRLAPYYKEFGLDIAGISPAPTRAPFNHDLADVLEEFKPPVVSFHFGLPSPALLERVRSWGSVVVSSATTLDEALWLEARGVDAVVAQGIEAGGHRGHFLSTDISKQMETLALVDQLVQQLKVPVIAAGGITTSDSAAMAMDRGAAAVQCGTAYLLCPEATTSPVHRAALKSDSNTALTNLFSGGVARGIINRAMRELGPINTLAPDFPLAAQAMAPLRIKAEATGSGAFSPLWSGQNRSTYREAPAAEITRALASKVL